jgi:hypothetical protein
MISPECFELSWLREQAEATRVRDPKNLEKCILALELVGRMQEAGLNFVFKGGTSLVLLFSPVRRLSIDVDILSLDFDVGELVVLAADLGQTIRTYHSVHEEQLRYRDGGWSIDQTLDDTQDAAFWVSRLDGHPKEENEKTEFFRKGIKALDSHLFTLPFKRPESRIAAGRAALLAELVRAGRVDFDLPGFVEASPDLALLKAARLEGDWENLNRLKITDIEAFKCWHQAALIRKGES